MGVIQLKRGDREQALSVRRKVERQVETSFKLTGLFFDFFFFSVWVLFSFFVLLVLRFCSLNGIYCLLVVTESLYIDIWPGVYVMDYCQRPFTIAAKFLNLY